MIQGSCDLTIIYSVYVLALGMQAKQMCLSLRPSLSDLGNINEQIKCVLQYRGYSDVSIAF